MQQANLSRLFVRLALLVPLVLLAIPAAASHRTTTITTASNHSTTYLPLVTIPADDSIAYIKDGDIFVMNVTGLGQTNLTNTPTLQEHEPAWSPDGQRIAFTRITDSVRDIFVMNVDGSGQTNLTNTPGTIENNLAWSPDGQRIVFVQYTNNTTSDIAVINADGSNQIQLTNTPNPTYEVSPTWSPDGKRVTFGRLDQEAESGTSTAQDIFIVNADGSGETNLTNTSNAGEFNPTWSPDGRQIAFVQYPFYNATPETVPQDIYLMNPDGSGRINLTNTPDVSEQSIDWSPDGTKLAFCESCYYAYASGIIYIINRDGSGRINPTKLVAPYQNPKWSPDGTKLAVVQTIYVPNPSPRGYTGEIWVINADGSGQTNLTNTPAASELLIDWAPRISKNTSP